MNRIEKEVRIPQQVSVRMEGDVLIVSGPKGENRRKFWHPHVKLDVKEDKVIVSSTSSRRKDKAVVGTWIAHIKNMIYGVLEGFEATLKIVYSHFPMNVKREGDYIVITNFLGEKGTRKARIVGDVEVSISKEEIVIKGTDIEAVGQTAANLEQVTKDKGGRDIRKFFDGIYISKKPKRSEEIWQ